MYYIYKITSDPVVDFAAEELKKYLRMMMPEAGDVRIVYDPAATDGFRLGLLEAFGISSEAEDPLLDDVVHVDTRSEGGILAGSNPRSVLFAVYRMLRENGCRWLYPGIDGEHIPMQDIHPVFYHKMADHRFRGHCNEGAESQQCMLETIDFYAKQGLNAYMLEFQDPFVYYHRYYNHTNNRRNRKSEPVTHQQTVQWKRQCEVEIAKRGLQFHDIGHGWTAEPLGLDSSDGWIPLSEVAVTEEQKQYFAMLDGKRELFAGSPLKTNLCMSTPVVQDMMANALVDYAQRHQNETYVVFSLADSVHSQCECPECQKAVPSEFVVQILNKADAEMTRRGIETRIAFSAYHDTLVPPKTAQLNNPKRFCLEYCPITRSYTTSITERSVIPEQVPEYRRNQFQSPESAEANFAYFRQWQQFWESDTLTYEYHFWVHQYNDPGLMDIARRVYEDIRSLKFMGLGGCIEDGSQRSFFPNGFHMHVYAETLFDRSSDFDAMRQDYFRHLYGEDWQTVADLLEEITKTFDFGYMEGEKSADPDRGAYYDPQRAKILEAVPELAQRARTLAAEHSEMPTRPQTVSYRLLGVLAKYMELLAPVLIQKALGNDQQAQEMVADFIEASGKLELPWERYFDHFMVAKNITAIVKKVGKQLA